MYSALQKELDTFVRRTPKSAEAHKKNLKRIPLGVASNYRAYDPYPIFVKEAQGSHFRDLDGNDYIDHNLCFGALMAGNCRKRFATASPSRWFASATAAPKPQCTPYVWHALPPGVTRSSSSKGRIT